MIIARRALSARTVRADALDELAFADVRARAPRLEGLVARAPQMAHDDGTLSAYPAWEALVADLFTAHHAEREPAIRPAEEVLTSHRLNRRVMAELLGRPELLAARAHTRSRELESALSVMGAADALREALEGALRDAARRSTREEQGDGAGAAPDEIPEGHDPALARAIEAAAIEAACAARENAALPHGGKSFGSCRQLQPVRTTLRIALTISRRGWVSGLPPGRGAASSGATSSHCASVRSDGYRPVIDITGEFHHPAPDPYLASQTRSETLPVRESPTRRARWRGTSCGHRHDHHRERIGAWHRS